MTEQQPQEGATGVGSLKPSARSEYWQYKHFLLLQKEPRAGPKSSDKSKLPLCLVYRQKYTDRSFTKSTVQGQYVRTNQSCLCVLCIDKTDIQHFLIMGQRWAEICMQTKFSWCNSPPSLHCATLQLGYPAAAKCNKVVKPMVLLGNSFTLCMTHPNLSTQQLSNVTLTKPGMSLRRIMLVSSPYHISIRGLGSYKT